MVNTGREKSVIDSISIDDTGSRKPGPNGTILNGYTAYIKIGALGYFSNKDEAERQLIQEVAKHVRSLLE